jgi:hypothetical protein
MSKCFYCGEESDELEGGICPPCRYDPPDVDDDGWDDEEGRAESPVYDDTALVQLDPEKLDEARQWADQMRDDLSTAATAAQIERQREDGYLCAKIDCMERPTHECVIQGVASQYTERYCEEHFNWVMGLCDMSDSQIASDHDIEVLEFAAPHGDPRFIVLHTFDNNRIEAHASITNWSVPAMARALLEAGYAGRLGAVTFNSPALLVMALDGDMAGAADALAAPEVQA